MSEAVTVEGFDLSSKAVQANPYPYYKLLQAERPVFKTDFQGQPCWVLSRRKDVANALMDPQTFSSRTAPIENLLFADPPEHSRLRAMVAAKFTRGAVAPMAARVGENAGVLLDRCLAVGRFDAIAEFASPLTITMMGQLLGIPVEAVNNIRGLTHLLAEFVLEKFCWSFSSKNECFLPVPEKPLATANDVN